MPDSVRDLRVYDSVLETIGWTPMIRLTRVTRGIRTPVWAKAETFNPRGPGGWGGARCGPLRAAGWGRAGARVALGGRRAPGGPRPPGGAGRGGAGGSGPSP